MSIHAFHSQVENALALLVEKMGEKNRLRDACEYALLKGGKRIRPILVLMMQEALGSSIDLMDAALSVECFHTASLIADDLPCMDNDDWRRERPSLHKVFGESVALLASYTLIAEGYGRIACYRQSCPEEALLCLEEASRCAGIQGATGGQFLDLYPPDDSLETIQKTLYQKTVTLFEIALVFGWLLAKGSKLRLDAVRKAAFHLGMAFQIGDDLLDAKSDIGAPNIARKLGQDVAYTLFEQQMESWMDLLEKLELLTPSFSSFSELLFQHYTNVKK